MGIHVSKLLPSVLRQIESKIGPLPKKRHKYHAKPQTVDGVRFASQKEARRDGDLQNLQRAGEIYALERQPRFPLVIKGEVVATYVADWKYVEKATNKLVAEDAKGVETPEFKLKFAIAKLLYPDVEFRTS